MPFPIRTARRGAAVLPGRLPYDLSAPTLLLHTIQTAAAFEELLFAGRLVPDPAKAEPEFADAYSWMLRQMERRLPTRGQAALWLWARIRREDLLHHCRSSGGHVLLTCRIHRERVLLSQYDDWHAVLNGSPNVLPNQGESDDEYGSRLDSVLDEFYTRVEAAGASKRPPVDWPEELREEIESSWDSILNPANYPRTAYWQATIHELRAEDIVEAVLFEN